MKTRDGNVTHDLNVECDIYIFFFSRSSNNTFDNNIVYTRNNNNNYYYKSCLTDSVYRVGVTHTVPFNLLIEIYTHTVTITTTIYVRSALHTLILTAYGTERDPVVALLV